MSDRPLAEQDCVPCRGGLPRLTGPEAEALRADTPAWSLQDADTRIERRLAFDDFAATFAFIEKVAALAEAQGHHPDICFGWGYATVSLHTHAIKGLHANDFILAAKIDALTAA